MATREERRAALIRKFKEIGAERVQRLSLGWVHLEQKPDDADAAAEFLRELHTLKGEARTVGFADIALLTHKLESLAFRARDAGFKVERRVSDTLLAAVDAIGALLRRSVEEPQIDLDQIVNRVDATLPEPAAPAAPVSPGAALLPAVEPAPVRAQPPTAPAPAAGAGAHAKPAREDSVRVKSERVGSISDLAGELLVGHARIAFGVKRFQARATRLVEDLEAGRLLPAAVRERALELALQTRELDDQVYRHGLDVQALDGTARELRLVPVGTVLAPYARVVRDLAADIGKEVLFEVEGGDIEADRRVLDMLEEPLLHLLRNAVDHGIEPPDERVKAGKSRHGRVVISVRATGGALAMTVRDDGVGLNARLLRRKAVERGAISAEAAAALSEGEALELVFLPGFSTRDQATHLSGRGVGMDVVKRRVEEFGGRVALESVPGKGLATLLTAPLQVSLTRALVLNTGRYHVAIPAAVVEYLRAVGPEARLTNTHEGRGIRLPGGEVLPAISLEDLLDRGGTPVEELAYAAVVRAGVDRCALLIAEPGREMDMVVKPLGPPLARLALFAGAGALPDGRLVVMLDAAVLLRGRKIAARNALVGPTGARRSWRLLLVDDSVVFRSTISAIGEGLGHQITTADDGLDALEALRHFDAQAIITDIQMPRMDGLALIRAIRADPRHAHTPIIVLSSLGSADDRTRAAEAGASAYLVKSGLEEAHIDEVLKRLLG